MKKRAYLLFFLVMGLGLSACGLYKGGESKNLTENLKKSEIQTTENDRGLSEKETGRAERALFQFSADVFQKSLSQEDNTLISPLSVMYALGMTANGADHETLAEMEAVFGLSAEELNLFLKAFSKKMKTDREGFSLKSANSIWIKDEEGFEANEDFLMTNTSVYDADIFKTKFDETAKKEINDWVEKKTDGRIKEILKKIPEDAVMYLINALTFDAKWLVPYKDYEVLEHEFTSIDGKRTKISFLSGEEDVYLENEKAIGFAKSYEGKFDFVGLLPKENTSIYELVESLDGAAVSDLWETRQSENVITGLPPFKTEYNADMKKVLQALGMKKAFLSDEADFTRLGKASGNIYLSRVLHKTFIEVDKDGTKAAATTVVEATEESAAIKKDEPKIVVLDRPFVYMIVERESGLPIFMGTLLSLE